MNDDLISRQAVHGYIDRVMTIGTGKKKSLDYVRKYTETLSSAQPDYTEMKQEFLRMASYIDVLIECSDEQKETLIGFISRLSEYMPWTVRD